jgi:uncharacterized iron-regulated membrane protein
MNKSALIIASTIALFAIFITGTQLGVIFAQIQSTQSATQSAQPGQPAQPQQLGQPAQQGPTTQSDHSGQNQTGQAGQNQTGQAGQNQTGQAGQNQTGQAKGPLEQMGVTLGKIIGQK